MSKKYFAQGIESSSDYIARKKYEMNCPSSIIDGTTSFCCQQKKEKCKDVLYPCGEYNPTLRIGMQPCRYKQTKPRKHKPHPCQPCHFECEIPVTICTNPLLSNDPCNPCKKYCLKQCPCIK